MSDLDDYNAHVSFMPPGYGRDTLVRLADAAVESLKTCGNCGHFSYSEVDYEGGHCECSEIARTIYEWTIVERRDNLATGKLDPNITPSERCHFNPSRWTERR